MVWEEPKNIVVARGPQGEFINILDDLDFTKWHRREGLKFINCVHDAHIVDRSGTRFLRHNPKTDEGERCAQERARRGPVAFFKPVLTAWIKSFLKTNGFPVLSPPRGTPRADVMTRSGTRKIAIRLGEC